jgi:methanethiol S-methyltransferase
VANPFLAGSIDLALIAAFGLQHSLMARPALKARWPRIVLPAFERATYVHAANLVLLALIFCWQPIPLELWRLEEPLLRHAGWLLLGLGWSILLAGARPSASAKLVGVRQILDWYHQREPQPLRLKTTRLHRRLRHLLYVDVLWGSRMTLGHALLALGLTVYVMIARRYEERDLSRAYGTTYRKWTQAGAASRQLAPDRRASVDCSRQSLSTPVW